VVEGSLINSLLDSINDHQMVADAALNYLSAGRDTTAQSLTWTFYLLIRHPSILPNLLSEIKSLQSKTKTKTRDQSKNNTAIFIPTSLPFVMATIYESLRLYPPVPFELKQCMKSDGVVLPDGTYLPFKGIVVWCPWAMSRSEEIWPSPSSSSPSLSPTTSTSPPTPITPSSFHPPRWLKRIPTSTTTLKPNLTNQLLTRPAHEFPVFNGGSRTCLGKKMAEAVMCQVVACLVERYVFSMEGSGAGVGMEKVSRNSLTLPMEGGLVVGVVRR